MALIYLNVGFADLDGDSITQVQFRTRPVGSTGSWTEKAAQPLATPQTVSPISLSFDSTLGVVLVSGMYNLQVKLSDGYSWSDWSTTYSIEIGVESFLTNIVRSYNLTYASSLLPACGEIFDFNVYKCGSGAGPTLSTFTIQPTLNSGTGFKVDIYQDGITVPLIIYSFGSGTQPQTQGFLADATKNYKLVITPSQYNNSNLNSVEGNIIFLNDSNPLTKTIPFKLRRHGATVSIPTNGIWVENVSGVWTIYSMYNVASNRTVVVIEDGVTKTYTLVSGTKSIATTTVNTINIIYVGGTVDGIFYYVAI